MFAICSTTVSNGCVCVTYFHSRNEFVDFQIFGFIRAVIETKQELGRAIPICTVYQKCALNASIGL